MLIKRPATGLLFLIVLLAINSTMHAQNLPAVPDAPVAPAAPAGPAAPGGEGDDNDIVQGIQLPGNPATDVAKLYENLTGKTLILDSQLNGPTLTIMVSRNLHKKEAISLIESALILNGYSIVNVDDHTAKLLGPSKPARTEAVPLYDDPSQLPAGDQIVSFFMPFQYLKSDDALNTFMQFSPFHPNSGNYVQVPSVNAVVATESAPIIRKLLALKELIDVEGAKTVTEFIPLQRADAEKVVEIISKIFEKDEPGSRTESAVVQPNGSVAQPAPAPAGAGVVSGVPGKVQAFADKRTNRVMIVAPESRMAYIRSIVENLDVATEFDEVLDRPLRFVRAAEVLPVLQNLLVEGKGDGNSPTGAQAGADDKTNQPESNNDNNNSNSNNPSNSGGSGGSSDIGLADKTSFASESTKPLSVIVGNTRIIADRSVNRIIVIGPPEARDKAEKVLDILDERPKQVYLACVIGQLSLTNNLDFGIDYLMKFGNVRILGQGTADNINNLLSNRSASTDIATTAATAAASAAATAATTAATTALPVLSGLTVYGAIANSVDILARAMAATGRFQIISRPVVYTANGQGALISSGQEVPVPTNSLSSVVDTSTVNNTGTSLSTSIDYKKVVLELDVRPLINSDKEVTLQIRQRNDTIQSNITVANNQVPVIATQTLNTTVTVPNRQTIVLGGLISDQENKTSTGIPLLKDIPGLGYLFASTTINKTRSELVIMIQPFIVNDDNSLQTVNYIERSNTSLHEHMFDQPVPVKPASLPGPDDVIPGQVR